MPSGRGFDVRAPHFGDAGPGTKQPHRIFPDERCEYPRLDDATLGGGGHHQQQSSGVCV